MDRGTKYTTTMSVMIIINVNDVVGLEFLTLLYTEPFLNVTDMQYLLLLCNEATKNVF